MGQWISSWVEKSVRQDQILVKYITFHLRSNTLGKDINPAILFPVISEKTESYAVTSLGE